MERKQPLERTALIRHVGNRKARELEHKPRGTTIKWGHDRGKDIMHTPPGLEPGERQSRVASTEPRRTNTTKLAHISLHSEPVLLNQCPDLGDKGMDQSSSRVTPPSRGADRAHQMRLSMVRRSRPHKPVNSPGGAHTEESSAKKRWAARGGGGWSGARRAQSAHNHCKAC